MANPKSISILVVGTKWPPETFLARLFGGWLEAGLQLTVATSRKPAQKWLGHSNFRWLRTPTWNKNPLLLQYGFLMKQYTQKRIENHHDLSKIRGKIKRKQSGSKTRAWNRLLPFVGGDWDIVYCPWAPAMYPYLAIIDSTKA